MRKIVILAGFLVLSVVSNAQQNLNSVYVPPNGLQVTYKLISNTSLSPGAAGNQSWDFSGLTYTNSYSNTYKDASETTYGSSFPSSNIGLYDFVGTTSYYNWSSTNKEAYGKASYNGNTMNTYSNSLKLLQLPLTYNQSTSDTYSGNGSSTSQGTSYTISGTSTTLYDGYGTIKTFQATYTDAVRIKTTIVETQTNTSNSAVTTITTTYYDWYTLSSGKLVFSFTDMTTASAGGSVSSKAAYSYAYPVATGMAEADFTGTSFSLSPNPVMDKLSIDFSTLPSDQYLISVVDRNGVIVWESNGFVHQGEVRSIDTFAFNSGMYVLNVTSATHSRSSRFIKK